ncbi:unnamed protein product [Symbiodinium sp. CCMP2592]|nr:unnamed protein product [Symbiodinium sp. CCMP2592]
MPTRSSNKIPAVINRNAVVRIYIERVPLFRDDDWLKYAEAAKEEWPGDDPDFAAIAEFLRRADLSDRFYLRESVKIIVERKSGDLLCITDHEDVTTRLAVRLERLPLLSLETLD